MTELETKVAALEATDKMFRKSVSDDISEIKDSVKTLFDELNAIKVNIYRRPSWITATVITILCSAVTGLAIALMQKSVS